MSTFSSPENKEQALQTIHHMVEKYDISLKEIQKNYKKRKSYNKNTKDERSLSKIIGYLGAIFIFGGLCLLINLIWSDLGSASRVILSYGSGLSSFFSGYIFAKDKKFETLSFPFYLISVILLPFGMFVFLSEYTSSKDLQLAIIFVFSILALQFTLVFLKDKKTYLLFFAYFFFYISFATILERLNIPHDISGLVTGLSIIGFALYFDKTPHKSICPFWYFIGSVTYFSAIGLMLFNLELDIDFIGLVIGLSMISYGWHFSINQRNFIADIFHSFGAILFLFSIFSFIKDAPYIGLIIGASTLGLCLYFNKRIKKSLFLFWYFIGILIYLISINNVMSDLDIPLEFIGISLGLTIIFLGWDFNRNNYNLFSNIFYIIGSFVFLFSLFDIVQNKAFYDLIYLVISIYMMIASVRIKSHILLIISTFAIIGFLGYFTKEYFANTTGWPIALIIFGFFLIGTSHYALKLGKKIRPSS